MADPADCSLTKATGPGICGWCAGPLSVGRRRWCSDRCAGNFRRNHWWAAARAAARRRDGYRCVRCGRSPRDLTKPQVAGSVRTAAAREKLRAWRAARLEHRLEVDHLEPCLGRHAEVSCAHHLDNLQTLCRPCHLNVTATRKLAAPLLGGS